MLYCSITFLHCVVSISCILKWLKIICRSAVFLIETEAEAFQTSFVTRIQIIKETKYPRSSKFIFLQTHYKTYKSQNAIGTQKLAALKIVTNATNCMNVSETGLLLRHNAWFSFCNWNYYYSKAEDSVVSLNRNNVTDVYLGNNRLAHRSRLRNNFFTNTTRHLPTTSIVG